MKVNHLPFLVAVETDPTRYHGENPVTPGVLGARSAEQLMAHIATDLAAMFPEVSRLTMSMTGALFDQTQILQPGLPLFDAMQAITEKRLGKSTYSPSMVSIGSSNGHMPHADLQPDAGIPPGVLQLIACTLTGPDESIRDIEEAMEHRFMEEGQLSPKSASGLENAFGIASTHARFMTLTDLMAMLKLQLEHFGFGGLWTLLDAAMEVSAERIEACGSAGQSFSWQDGRIVAQFQTFDYWGNHGAGSDRPSEEMVQGYVDWTREYRQYLVTLEAHNIKVTQQLPDTDVSLEGAFFVESGTARVGGEPASITEHSSPDLGLIAITVVQDGQIRHYYPLQPEGMNLILEEVFANGGARDGISFPGTICLDSANRRLSADRI